MVPIFIFGFIVQCSVMVSAEENFTTSVDDGYSNKTLFEPSDDIVYSNITAFEPSDDATYANETVFEPFEDVTQANKTVFEPFDDVTQANKTMFKQPSELQNYEQVEESANTMFDEYWQIVLLDYPELASKLGDHRYDDRLTTFSLKCYEKKKVMMNEFLERANQMLSLAQEGSETQLNIQMFITNLQFKLDRLMSGSYLFPFSKLNTPQMGLHYLLKYTKPITPVDYWNLLARYRAFPKQIDEKIELMREGIRTNFTLHEVSMISNHNLWNRTVEESPFYKPFLNISDAVPAEYVEAIQENATDAIANYLIPAFKKVAEFMEEEYRPHARESIGVGSLPNGRDFYHHELSFHLTDTEITANEIHVTGMREVERIAEEMEEVIQSLGLNISRKEFSDQLRNDKSQFFSSEEEALETYRNVLENVIAPKLPKLFKKIPQKVLTVDKIPKDLASGPQAYYMSPSPDNSTPGTFFLDTSSLGNLPKYDVITLAMHEGVPGHHFQKSYAMERMEVPEFRKYGIQSTAFTEGWALYAEYLGYELGLYSDPYMRYGHLSYEIFRACRMVVDTGMHVLGWSRQQAIDHMLNYSAASLNNIEREVDRYITWPGQACAYKYGELKIKELRKKAEAALGDKFDIKEFHEVVLRTNGPMQQVAKEVDRHIKAVQSSLAVENPTVAA